MSAQEDDVLNAAEQVADEAAFAAFQAQFLADNNVVLDDGSTTSPPPGTSNTGVSPNLSVLSSSAGAAIDETRRRAARVAPAPLPSLAASTPLPSSSSSSASSSSSSTTTSSSSTSRKDAKDAQALAEVWRTFCAHGNLTLFY